MCQRQIVSAAEKAAELVTFKKCPYMMNTQFTSEVMEATQLRIVEDGRPSNSHFEEAGFSQ